MIEWLGDGENEDMAERRHKLYALAPLLPCILRWSFDSPMDAMRVRQVQQRCGPNFSAVQLFVQYTVARSITISPLDRSDQPLRIRTE